MMKLLILTTLFGISLACGSHGDCKSCADHGGCFWDLGAKKCKSILLQPFVNKANVIPKALSCPTALPAFQYTDDFGRNTALVFTMASNGEGETAAQTCITNRIPNAQVHKQYTVNCDWVGSSCSATVFLHPDANAVVLAFRGTKGATQFFIETINLIIAASSTGPYYNGRVFTYFSKAFGLLWGSGLASDLSTLLQENPNAELWIFGHSLGGSLATLAGNAAVRQGFITGDRVRVVTMGEPRTGDYDFAADVGTNIPQTYRIVKQTDLVTKMPLKLSLEQTNAYHNNFEVWYNNDMSVGSSFAVNNRADDYSGSNTVNYDGSDSHNSYFNVDMDTYQQQGCPAQA